MNNKATHIKLQPEQSKEKKGINNFSRKVDTEKKRKLIRVIHRTADFTLSEHTYNQKSDGNSRYQKAIQLVQISKTHQKQSRK